VLDWKQLFGFCRGIREFWRLKMQSKRHRRFIPEGHKKHRLPAPLFIVALFCAILVPAAGTAESPEIHYVIHVVFDGFRPDAITSAGPEKLPNVYRMIREGSWTANARSDYDFTETLQNHTDMLTSRPVSGPHGHGVNFNLDNGGTIHEAAGSYVAGVFDIVHDSGLRTGLFASKDKFEFFDRSWNAENGRRDTIGKDNGRDKIDVYRYNSSTGELTKEFIAAMAANPFNYAMISLRDPDSVGHNYGWMSDRYLEAVQEVDGYLGQIISLAETSPVFGEHTVVLLVADHGGTKLFHGTAEDPLNYTIPFLIWGAGVTAGGDLYALNPATRVDPGGGRPDNTAAPQPVRNGDAANLSAQLLGLGIIDGSFFNSSPESPLKVSPDTP
jgi:hypothetical protein